MAKTIYPPEISQLGDLKKLNTALSKHCIMYCIVDENVYLMARESYLAKVAKLLDKSQISCYNNTVVDPMELRKYLASLRKTTAIAEPGPSSIVLSDSKTDDRRAEVHRLSINWEEQVLKLYPEAIRGRGVQNIIPGVADLYEPRMITESQIATLNSGFTIGLDLPDGGKIYVVKSLFGNLKATQCISYSEVKGMRIPDLKKRYVLFCQSEPMFIIYILAACISPWKE